MLQYNVSFELYMDIQYKSEKSCHEDVKSVEWKANNLAYYTTRNFVIYESSLTILADYVEIKETRIC